MKRWRPKQRLLKKSFRRSLNAACLRSRTEQRMREVPSQAFRHISERGRAFSRGDGKALEEAKETLLSVHEQQEEVLADTSEAARAVTENLAMRQKKQAEIQKRERKARAAEAEAARAEAKKKRKAEYWQDARREREREEKKRSLPDRRRETRPQPRWEAA